MGTGAAKTKSREKSSKFAKTMRNHRKDAGNSLYRLAKAPLSSCMTVLVIAAALLLPSLLFSLNSNLASLLAGFENNARIVLYLTAATEDARAMEVSESLLTYNDIDLAEFVSKEDALRDFSNAAGFTELLAGLDENPLPSTIVITPNMSSLDGLDSLAATLEAMPEVDLVQVDSLWLRRLAAISDLIGLIARTLGLIVILSLCFIVGNTVRLHIENRKEEIKVIKLVGGTHSYIARPFLYTGLFYGILGGILASILQASVFLGFSDAISVIATLYSNSFELPLLTPVTVIFLTISGGLVGWLAAVIAGYRHIGAINP
ncbi:MAG: FtsX-like permease family protein [Pseudomonadales bacterium]|nr:FtsX-like permease family protein [Pseudomonadales bacterium]